MKQTITAVVLAVALAGGALVGLVGAAEMKVIQTQKAKDAVVTLKSDTGQWTQGKNSFALEITTPDGKPYNPDFVKLAEAFGITAERVQEPDDLPAALTRAVASGVPYLLDVWTRGDVPMPRTGHWDIAEFLISGTD